MERLTFKVHDGGIFVKESDVKTFEVEDEIMHTGNAIRKLAEYEDLEEQGLLLKLPCKVGDTIYYFMNVDDVIKIRERKVATLTNLVAIMENSDFGKTVFLTEAEAEEAIEELKECVDLPYGNDIKGETAKVAISALKEIQQYRDLDDKLQTEIGITVKELYEKWNVMLAEYLEYQQLGTVEELREAREKQVPKTPYMWGDGYSDGKLVYDMYDCPNCGESYEIDGAKYDFCPNCGQAIDWREQND